MIKGKVGQRFYDPDNPEGVVYEVDGFIEGGLGVARSSRSPSVWTITHLQSGRAVCPKAFNLRRDALSAMQKFLATGIDWTKGKDEIDTEEHRRVVTELGLW